MASKHPPREPVSKTHVKLSSTSSKVSPKKPLSAEDQKKAERLWAIWKSKHSELSLTQITAAKKLGITQSALNQYLKGTIPLNTDMTLKLAALLKTSPFKIAPSLKKLFPEDE